MEILLDETRLLEAKVGRNSGRTFDALYSAVVAAGKYPTVCFLTCCDAEVERIHKDVRLICEHFEVPFILESRTKLIVGGSSLLIFNANYQGKGCRAHFILDHSVSEELSHHQFEELRQSLRVAHEGEVACL